MANFDPVTGEPLTPEAKAARAAQNAGSAPAPQPVYDPQPANTWQPASEEDLLKVNGASAAPQKKAKPAILSKLPLIGGIVGGIAVIAGIVLLIGSLSSSPVDKLVKGAENTVKALSATELGSTVTKLADSGSVTLSVDLSKNEDLAKSLFGTEMDAKAELAFFAKDSSAAAVSLNASLDGKALADVLLTLSKDDLAVSSTALLSKTNYGINLKNMAKNLKGSVFDPDEDTEYSLDEDTFAALTGKLTVSELEALAKDGREISKKMIDTLSDSVNKHGEIKKASEKITIGDSEISTSTVTIELDNKAMQAVAADMVEYLRKDKDVKKFLTKIMDLFADTPIGEQYGIDDEFVEDFYDWLEDIRDYVSDDMEDELEDCEITLTGWLKGSNLVQIQIDLKADKSKETLRLSIGPDPKNPQEITLYVKEYSGSKTTVSYKVSANDKNSYEASLTAKTDSDTPMKAKISWDKKEGTLKVSAEVTTYSYWYGTQTTSYDLKGSMTQSGKKTVIEPSKLTIKQGSEEEEISLKGITLTIDGGASFPSISKYTDILTLDEEELEELIEDISESMSELMGDVMGGASSSGTQQAVPAAQPAP